jgi:hypothetical protein
MFKDMAGQLLAYWILERCTTPVGVPGLSQEDFGSEKIHSLYKKISEK